LCGRARLSLKHIAVPRNVLCKEIEGRIEKTRAVMEERGYDALLVYGNNKVVGSIRYLTDYFPDRAGWISLGTGRPYLFEGAVFAITIKGEPVLLLDPGLIADKRICAKTVLKSEGLSAEAGEGLSPKNIAQILEKAGATGKVGIETWDRFPAPVYLGMRELLPRTTFERSTIVEELRMVKSPLELQIFRSAGKAGDMAHEVFAEALKKGVGKTELEITRAAEHVMRSADPIYEDSCASSPSLICSGAPVDGSLLNLPSHTKRIKKRDVVHWDIGMRHNGYTIDTSRTKVVGRPSGEQEQVFETTLEMYRKVMHAARPGVRACELIEIADRIAKEDGYELWLRFLGHGTGLDAHERPDMGVEETVLAANMILAIEPRIAVEHRYLMGVEDMVLVTDSGAEALTRYEKALEL
jgi:Xaa-Pro aminopeptidase